jgi:carboxyl-terminal processing protease
VTGRILEDLYAYAETKKLKRDQKGINISSEIISLRLKALIARNIWGNDAYYPIILLDDKAVEVGLRAF